MKNGSKNRDSCKGMLYICATPIGNLQDITLRALDYLKKADFIAAENVNHTRKLLNHYGIRAPFISFRESNRETQSKLILHKLKKGALIVLVSDAGMPLISDPGSYLVKLLIKEKIPFSVLPGPSSVLTALIMSGYSGKKFTFWGFLSRKKSELQKELQSVAQEEKAVVIYESPYRLLKTLEMMREILEEREVAVCRELTKKFEEVSRGSPAQLLDYFLEHPPRGEITLVISPSSGRDPENQKDDCKAKLLEAIKKGCSPSEAVKKVAQNTSLPKNEVYKILVELKHKK